MSKEATMRKLIGCVALMCVGCGGSGDGATVDGLQDAGGFSGTGGAAAAVDAGRGGTKGTGGAAMGSGGTKGTGGVSGSGGAGGSGGAALPATCDTPPSPGLPAGAPALLAGEWKDISQGTGTASMRSCVALDPCHPATLYVCTGDFDASKGGIYKSTDAGSTWRMVGNVPGAGHLDEPDPVRVDPKNPAHLYAGDGVRGGTMGFWVSTDAGETFTMPDGFKNLQGLFQYDVYDVATDPTDFNHVLLSFHGAWGWTDSKWNTSSGVLESKDGGATWIVHDPQPGWGTGHAVSFLYDPERGAGDSGTWLLGTQGAGMWRTTDFGTTWKQVSTTGIQHGGGSVYYSKSGGVYATGGDKNMRSTDNGATWALVGPGGGYNGIIGDGTRLYTAKCFGPTPFITSLETDGVTWTDFNTQQFSQGVFRMAYDAVNGIVYSSQWGAGVLALKVK
jgi:hypothetical protein